MMKQNNNTFNIPIELPESDERRRDLFEKMLHNAQKRIELFAINHQWDENVSEPLVEKVRVFKSKDQFDDEVKSGFNLDNDMNLPVKFSAVVLDGILLAVTPEVYEVNYKEGQEEKAYEKLLAHEMAHEFHIRILEGNEDLMGPRWFFEGFALYAANQFEHTKIELTKKDIQMIFSSESVSYVYYRRLFDELLIHMNIKEAVEQAKKPSFEDLVKRIINY